MTEPKILLWDLESSPNLGWIWGKYEQNVIEFEAEWHLISIAWKWLGDRRVQVQALCDFERYATDSEDDYELAAKAHALFSEADIVIAHNGVQFDTKKAQARMAFHGFDPPSPFKEVDTLKMARRYFAFTSNRLDDLCQFLGLGKKRETGGFKTWLGCIRNDPKAWAKMKRYNQHDVVLLERLYLKLRPWAQSHPNLATITGRPDACPKCGAVGTLMARGDNFNRVTKSQKWQCQKCKGYCSSRKTEPTKTEYV